jgi:hypothetical protein
MSHRLPHFAEYLQVDVSKNAMMRNVGFSLMKMSIFRQHLLNPDHIPDSKNSPVTNGAAVDTVIFYKAEKHSDGDCYSAII